MGAGGYGAAGLSVRAGMGISELAGVCGKRAERSGVKAKAAAKGSMGRFPRKGQKSFKKNQNKAPWPREDAPPAPEHRGVERCPFPSPSGVPGRLAAGWHRSPSLEEFCQGVRAGVCLARGSQPAFQSGMWLAQCRGAG